eukprot:EC716249.1.p1 GENE.EC716249.1~~EC716249.1.p1  ORF type:complete len:129 (+),score=9.60 EC716249.1:143-529(+)
MDSLTQLQDWFDFIAERLYVSIGVLQRDAVALPEGEPLSDPVKDLSSSFAREIVHASRVLHAIIQQLPQSVPSPEEEAAQLKALEISNNEAGDLLALQLTQAEQWLGNVRRALKDLTDERLKDVARQE